MELKETTKQSEWIYNGKIVNLRKDVAVMPDGAEKLREVVEHPGGVGIVVKKKNGNIILVKQWRYPFSKVVTEIPAGKREKGEPPEETARRELKEETGFSAAKITKLGEIMTSPGFCNEVLHLYLAEDLQEGEQKPDDDEFLDLVEIPFGTAVKMVTDGELTDAKTVVGILLAQKKD